MKFRRILFSISLLFLLRCMTNIASGGGETTNGYITGALILEDGSPAKNVRVTLINEQYNPVKDGAIADSLIDTTDGNGNYFFSAPARGSYNIEAVHLVTGSRALIQQVPLPGDTVKVPTDTMKTPGTLRVILPEGTNVNGGYLFIRGTTFSLSIDTVNDTALIDSLPAGMIPDILLGQVDGIHLIAKNSYITSGSISEIESGISKTVFTSINNVARFDFITSCTFDNTGKIWVGTDKAGLFVFDKVKTWKQFDFPGHTIRCHKIDHNGRHWVGTNDGLYLFDGTAFYPMLIISGDTIRNNILSVFIDKSNKKWAVTTSMIFKGDSGAWQSWDYNDYGVSGYTDLLIDKSGAVWIGTVANGIIADYGTSRQIYSVSNSSLPSNTVNFLVQDSAGGVWAGTAGGLARISGSNLYAFTRANSGTKFTDISHGVVDGSGELWFSGDAINLCNFQNNRVYTNSFLWGKYTTIESIVIDQSGVIWSGSYGGGLVRMENVAKLP